LGVTWELGVVELGIDTAPSLAGALLIDKPPGPTSHDIVAFARRVLQISRVGHTGTLDPLATGLLVLLVGRATRLAQFLAADGKEYTADVRLGIATPTYDAASLSEVRGPGSEVRGPTDAEVAEVLERFRGTFLQTPPPYSAKKIASVPAYEKARKNQVVELKPVEVTVHELEPLTDLGRRTSDLGQRDATLLRLRVTASAGFYVRSLAHDIGQALGCGAHLEALRRTRAGQFRVTDALTLDRVEAEGAGAVIAPTALLGHMPSVTVTVEGSRRTAHGNPLSPTHLAEGAGGLSGGEGGPLRVVDGAGTLLAIAEWGPGGLLQPLVVLG
jgi:tRNA pseudouridine55 synthase